MIHRRESVVVISVMLLVVAIATIASLSLGPVARRMPLVVAVLTSLLLTVELAQEMRREADCEAKAAPPHGTECGGGALAPRLSRRTSERVLFLWIGGLLSLILVVGMAAGVPLFLLAYMRGHFRESWRASFTLAGTFALLLVAVLQYALGVPLHLGLLGGWLEAAS